MYSMFAYCSSLPSLDLSNFDMSGVTAMENMLDGCSGLAKIYTPYHVMGDIVPVLPVGENDKWYDSEQKAYMTLPVGLDHSIVLAKNRTPDATENPSDPSDPADPADPNNPTDPDNSGFPDDGKFRISEVPNQIYTGKAIKPAVVVYYGSRRLTEKADYTVAYKNNINANDAKVAKTAPTITVKGKGNYSGKQSITFVIEPKSIEGDDVTAIELAAAANGKVQRPVPNLVLHVDNKNKKLRNKKDFMVSYPDANKAGAYKEAGTYTVTVTGTKN
ncbi:MAG: hypothetical protein NC092_09405, partial [Butyrivibrio sp.]|nr:hypothetical protein [Butyrivibrio sp.]